MLARITNENSTTWKIASRNRFIAATTARPSEKVENVSSKQMCIFFVVQAKHPLNRMTTALPGKQPKSSSAESSFPIAAGIDRLVNIQAQLFLQRELKITVWRRPKFTKVCELTDLKRQLGRKTNADTEENYQKRGFDFISANWNELQFQFKLSKNPQQRSSGYPKNFSGLTSSHQVAGSENSSKI